MNPDLEDFAFDDQGRPVRKTNVSPEERCACMEEQAERLRQLGLSDMEIALFFLFTDNPNQEIDEP
jgi:hypothetical protein